MKTGPPKVKQNVVSDRTLIQAPMTINLMFPGLAVICAAFYTTVLNYSLRFLMVLALQMNAIDHR